jgi:elongation factor Ts
VPAELIGRAPRSAEKAAEEGCRVRQAAAEIVAKMVEGSVQKFLKEVSLLNQALRQERQADRRADAQGKSRHHR